MSSQTIPVSRTSVSLLYCISFPVFIFLALFTIIGHLASFSDALSSCQDIVKTLFADPVINKTQNLAAVNSINWARILAQITYYFHAYFSLLRSSSFDPDSKVRFVVPTGNFGDILAGYFAKRMGLPVEKLVIATNENDILDRFWKSGYYEKKAVHGQQARGGLADDGVKAHEKGVKETLSPAMDILVSSNFERLLWFLAYEVYGTRDRTKRETAGKMVKEWLENLRSHDGFGVDPPILELAKRDFESERVSDQETIGSIRHVFNMTSVRQVSNGQAQKTGKTALDGYVLDPHSAIGVAASIRSIARNPPPKNHHISLATAHPAKFANAVDLALKGQRGYQFESILPEQFIELEKKEKRVREVERGFNWEDIREIIRDELEKEGSSNKFNGEPI